MSGYNLAMFVLALLITTVIWMPLNEIFPEIVTSLNIGLTTFFAEKNILAEKIFSFSLFYMIILLIIWVLKPYIGGESL